MTIYDRSPREKGLQQRLRSEVLKRMDELGDEMVAEKLGLNPLGVGRLRFRNMDINTCFRVGMILEAPFISSLEKTLPPAAKDFVINGKHYRTSEPELSYWDLADILGITRSDYSVTYRGSEGAGILAAFSEPVEVTPGMVFNMVLTNNA